MAKFKAKHFEFVVLAVSDDEIVLEKIRSSFRKEIHNYGIVTSPPNEQILKTLSKLNPDIFLFDIDAGGKTQNLDFFMQLREYGYLLSIPILIISEDITTIKRAIKLGATDFVKKPIDDLELVVRVKLLLSLFKLIKGISKQTKELVAKSLETEHQKIELEEEKKKSDQLLQNILPKEIAEQLKNKGKVTAKKYRMVTIMFTDFKDFTRKSAALKPEEVIQELSIFFRKFDEITDEHFLEKIKTIGDAYMCVGGLPLRNRSNPIDTILAALKIQEFMSIYNEFRTKKGLSKWELRIGIHTGRVVAGVIGSKKFAYDVWGGDVNIASRLETASEVNKINISEVTYSYVKNYFNCTYRGKIPAKNLGEISMYFVEGIKKKYRSLENPILPNAAFKEIIAAL